MRKTNPHNSKNNLCLTVFTFSTLIFALSVPSEQLVFSNDLSQILLCTTFFDVILTCCAYSLARAIAAATRNARPHALHSRSLNILTANEPMGHFFRCLWLLLASHRMTLPTERNNLAE